MDQHVGGFIDAGHHGFEFGSRGRNVSIPFEFGSHLLMRNACGLSIASEQLQTCSIQPTITGQNAGAGGGSGHGSVFFVLLLLFFVEVVQGKVRTTGKRGGVLLTRWFGLYG